MLKLIQMHPEGFEVQLRSCRCSASLFVIYSCYSQAFIVFTSHDATADTEVAKKPCLLEEMVG
jgi:hypothetical protein